MPLSPTHYYPDPAISRELSRERVQCTNPGCTWGETFTNYPHHHSTCLYTPLSCDCDVIIPTIQLEEHQATECVLRVVACEYCESDVTVRDLPRHMDVCDMKTAPCPNDCGMTITTRDLATHTDPYTGNCTHRKCPFGCDQVNDEGHRKSDVVRHLNVLLSKMTFLQRFSRTRPETDPNLETIKTRITNLEKNSVELKKKLDDLRQPRDRNPPTDGRNTARKSPKPQKKLSSTQTPHGNHGNLWCSC